MKKGGTKKLGTLNQLTELGGTEPGPYSGYGPRLSVVTLPPWLSHLVLWSSLSLIIKMDMLDYMISKPFRVVCSAGFDIYFYLGLGSSRVLDFHPLFP